MYLILSCEKEASIRKIIADVAPSLLSEGGNILSYNSVEIEEAVDLKS